MLVLVPELALVLVLVLPLVQAHLLVLVLALPLALPLAPEQVLALEPCSIPTQPWRECHE